MDTVSAPESPGTSLKVVCMSAMGVSCHWPPSKGKMAPLQSLPYLAAIDNCRQFGIARQPPVGGKVVG